MRTPISYYGGKQALAKTILGLIPPHRVYGEPFAGGAAIFFAKEPAEVEIINDANGEVVNFYEVLKREFPALQREIETSLHSHKRYRQAVVVSENPELFDRVKRAWAVWILANSSYGGILGGGFGYDGEGKYTKKLANKRKTFTVEYAIRLQQTQIECCDALRIIKNGDAQDAFFYCDPPYVGADQGHYAGYMQADFNNLLKTLEAIGGKFLLSSYPNESLRDFARRNGWHTVELNMASSMTHGTTNQKKVEVLTANYPIAVEVEKLGKKQDITEKE